MLEYTAAIEKTGLKISHIFDPNSSYINLHPNTRDQLELNWAKRLRIPINVLIPQMALDYLGRRSAVLGGVYSFGATKE